MLTRRLLLRPLAPGDATFVHALLNEPAFLEFIGHRGVNTPQDALTYIEQHRARNAAGLGMRAVVLQNGAPVGMCGLVRRPWLPGPDLGYAITASAAGNGYASEAAAAVLAFAHTDLALQDVLAVVLPTNTASLRVLQRLLFEPQGTVTNPDTGETLSLLRHRQ